jgi:hypothetical protein
MAEPEHISSILARVFKELGKQYKGGCPSSDRKLEASTFQARQLPVEGENGESTA